MQNSRIKFTTKASFNYEMLLILIILNTLSILVSSHEDYLTVDLSGNIRIILTAPHGGKITTLTPDIPDREDGCFVNGECVFEHNCNNPDSANCGVSTLADSQTDDLLLRLRTEIYNLTQEWPKMVINNIHRKKLDANREINEATLNEDIPLMVFDWYHGNISMGISMLRGEPGILFDIHGYSNGNEKDWAMLGYLISKTELNSLDDTALDAMVNDSSIKNLAVKVKQTERFSSLLRGSASFGASMHAVGLDACPSPANSSPGSPKYYSGGYTTKTYKDDIDVIQVEVHYYHRSSSTRRQEYAEQLARAIVDFYNKYFEQDTTSQATTTTASSHAIKIKEQWIASLSILAVFMVFLHYGNTPIQML